MTGEPEPARPPRVRRAGVLLHPTALPGPYGCGDLGPEAEAFLAWAAAAGQGLWQVLPLGPPGAGESPYGALSSFAGNPLLISPAELVDAGLLPRSAAAAPPSLPGGRVDFAAAGKWKQELLRASWHEYCRRREAELQAAFESFTAEADWLADWALYAALRARHHGRAWSDWDAELRDREPGALARARRQLADEVGFHAWVQFLFFRQWRRLRAAAADRGIRILGDLPIYVPHDSADVWCHPDLFELDRRRRPRAVAGVPPDYFSSTGQLWGYPLYRWDRVAAGGYAFWVERVRAALALYDRVRLDHFRGFEAYWRVPAGAETAAGGRWVRGPGRALLAALEEALGGELPLVAEDLGVITPEVRALRDAFGIPGMKVLQFAFAESDSDHLPHHHLPDSVVYTGTHDNDTARGWFAAAGADERRRALDYLGGGPEEIAWALIRAAYTSVARLAVVPVQDLLGLGSEARMNTPGQAAGNWAWRLREGQLDGALAARLQRLAEVSGRPSGPP